MRYLLSFVLFFSLSVPTVFAQTDILEEEAVATESPVYADYCIRLNNVLDFPEYYFFLYEEDSSEYGIFTTSDCLPVVSDTAKIYAVKRQVFDPALISDAGSYFAQLPEAVSTPVSAKNVPVVSESSTKRIVGVHTLKSVTADELVVAAVEEQAFDAEGNRIVVPSPSASAEAARQVKKGSGIAWLRENWAIALPVAGCLIIGLGILIGLVRREPTTAVVEDNTPEQQ